MTARPLYSTFVTRVRRFPSKIRVMPYIRIRQVKVMDYTMAMKYISKKNKLGSVPGLDNVTELLNRLGNPQDSCKCLQIAGTNGKGSVFSYVQSVLMEAGCLVGRYVSPVIFTYLERFQIDGEYMSEEEFADILTEVASCADDMENEGLTSPTAFEIETAVAFMYFKKRSVDYALIECGLGGDMDATNVISHPVMSVIASVSRDHMELLGDSLTEIATHKAGIIKDNSLCVMAPQCSEVKDVFAGVCMSKHTELFIVDDDALFIDDMNVSGTHFTYRGKQYAITLLGEHQVINAALAVEVAKRLPEVDDESIVRGLSLTKWSGRFTHVCDMPDVYVDGAHNESAWKYLRKAVNKYFTNRKIIYIIGVLRDKEYNKMVDILCDTMEYAVVVTPDTPRGLDKAVLAELIEAEGVPAVTADDAGCAIRLALDKYDSIDEKPPVILVCGSLSFISEYLRHDRWESFHGKK